MDQQSLFELIGEELHSTAVQAIEGNAEAMFTIAMRLKRERTKK